MDDLTSAQFRARRKQLENDAASQLGYMIFEFSRLDMNIGLCLVWVDGGGKLDSLTKSVEALTLSRKLDEVKKHVEAKLQSESEARNGYEAWILRVQTIRQQRNNLVHGRWGVEERSNQVVNVVGLPTSDEQQVTRYSIDELVGINDELQALQVELDRLRTRWPL